MNRAFSSIRSGLDSCFSSSQASQKRMFSSEYSQRRKSRKTLRPAELFISLSNDFPHARISSNGGLQTERRHSTVTLPDCTASTSEGFRQNNETTMCLLMQLHCIVRTPMPMGVPEKLIPRTASDRDGLKNISVSTKYFQHFRNLLIS